MAIRRTSMSNWKAQSFSKFDITSPNLRLIDAVLKTHFQFFYNGGYSKRSIRGGSSWSIHSWGAAVDSSWRNSDRAHSLKAIAWIVENSDELHVESVHDYKGSRIWHADRSTCNDVATALRDGATGGGWKKYTGSGTGWGDWIHYETTIDGWDDTTPIGLRPGLEMPGATAAQPLGECKCDEIVEAEKANDWPVVDFAAGKYGLWPLNSDKPTIRPDQGKDIAPDLSDATMYAQAVVGATPDGDYGPKSQAAVKAFQTKHGLKADAYVGKNTWAKIDAAA